MPKREQDVTETLSAVISRYESSRGAGHTEAVLKGCLAVQSVIVVGSQEFGRSLISRFGGNRSQSDFGNVDSHYVTLGGLRHSQSFGFRRPLVFDNHALLMVFQESLDEIISLRKKVIDMENGRR
jgi:hypothetical protein